MNPQAESNPSDSKRQTGAPPFPSVNLQKALALVRTVWAVEKRNAAPVPGVLTHWGYKPKSSGGFMAIAALKRFGLLDEEGSNEKRTVKLSDLALSILKNEETDATEFRRLLKDAAMRPKMHQLMWQKFGAELPSPTTLKSHLVFDYRFGDEAASEFLKEYTDTLKFAKLIGGDGFDEIQDDGENSAFTQGAQNTKSTTTQSPPAEPHQNHQTPATLNASAVPSGLIEIPVPLPSGIIAYYRVPPSMTEMDFTFYHTLWTAYKPGLVKPT